VPTWKAKHCVVSRLVRVVVLRQPGSLVREAVSRERLLGLVRAVAPGNALCFIDLVAAAIQIGMNQGLCQADDPQLTATLLYRACQGTSHQYCVADEIPDRDRLVAAVQSFVRSALGGPPIRS
jgi:hypothetical protein